MMTLRQLADRPATLPTATTWYLADIGQALRQAHVDARPAATAG